ncbi:DUF4424 family protein [Cypionkella psychrotolerans]|uniref:DUF4424 family protein n=1 Tax=Cypionkella psychrotolerans TaxID=1678131 RepID=UPI0006B58048|nr:DUF4424 family protein [Cypionkella psychrotolerans]
MFMGLWPRGKAVSLVLAASLFGAGYVLANPIASGIDTGEISLAPNASIELVEEDLYLSVDTVKARYLFRNSSMKAVRTGVAFPLPPIDYSEAARWMEAQPAPERNLGFSLWIDGQAAIYELDVRAKSATGADISDILAKWDIPVADLVSYGERFEELMSKIASLPLHARQELYAAGVIKDDGNTYGPKSLPFRPDLETYINFQWTMEFDPNVPVEVLISYSPVPSSTPFALEVLDADPMGIAMKQVFCLDSGILSEARRILATNSTGSGILRADMLSYILTTANSWRGRIGRFHLTIDTLSTDAIASTCLDGIHKTGPTTLEWERFNFQPEDELSVLFLSEMIFE